MTTRERFLKVLDADPTVDRSPVIEWCPWWNQTIKYWENEGIPTGMTRAELSDFFGLDPLCSIAIREMRPGCPSRPTNNAVPIIIENEADYDRLKHWFYPEDAVEQKRSEILQAIPRFERGEVTFGYSLHGYFWFPRTLFGDEAHLYAFYDYPELYHRICSDLLQWHIQQIDALAKYAKSDYMVLSEDMSYNHGSLISKAHFDEFLLPYYKKLIPEIKKYGTKVILDSDGDITDMIPWFIEAGFDGVAPLERQAGVDLVALRKKYPDLLLVGGFDKKCLLQGKEAIRREFERLLPVIEQGKYIVSVDHQTPPGVTLDNYRYYIQLYKEYAVRACKHLL